MDCQPGVNPLLKSKSQEIAQWQEYTVSYQNL
ncbi:hypothetical protein At12D1_22120 [Agrobacterium tumefaciens]|nr:hypothetical protein At12D1_22120 [Agrobacterium tumefaciens]